MYIVLLTEITFWQEKKSWEKIGKKDPWQRRQLQVADKWTEHVTDGGQKFLTDRWKGKAKKSVKNEMNNGDFNGNISRFQCLKNMKYFLHKLLQNVITWIYAGLVRYTNSHPTRHKRDSNNAGIAAQTDTVRYCWWWLLSNLADC